MHIADATMTPHMTQNERDLFARYLNTATKYIEFGCGGSTFLAATYRNIQLLHSVESDPIWITKLQEQPEIQQAIAEKRLYLHHGDIGPVGTWGVPSDTLHVHQYPAYYWGIWRSLPLDADCILVDGRFRVATVLMTLLMLQERARYILIHDFSSRPMYHIVNKYLAEVDTAEDLTAFTVKPKNRLQDILLDLHDYLFLPGDTPDTRPSAAELLKQKESVLRTIPGWILAIARQLAPKA